MIRLFIRFYLGVTIAIVISIFLAAILLDQQYQKTLGQDYLLHSRALHDHIENQLSNAPQDSWQTIIKQHQERYAYLIDIVDAESLSDVIKQQIETSGVSVSVKTGAINDEVILFYRLKAGHQIIKYTAKDLSEINYNWMLLIYFLLLMLALAAVVFILAKPISSHIASLAKVSQQIGNGQLQSRANENGPYPLNHLAKTINQMATQLEQLLKEQEIMTGAISHELRTPMANLRFALDMTRDIDDIDKLRTHIEEMDQDIDAMQSLIHELLTYARLNQNLDNQIPPTIDVNKTINKVLEQVKLFRSDIDIQLNTQANIKFPLFINDFSRALINLLRNAQRYANANIQMTVGLANNQLLITLEDDGPGIPLSARKDVFIPFKRIEQSRNKDNGGYGLGLAIVERILKKHHGHVTLSDSKLGGAKFTLCFVNNELPATSSPTS